MKHSDNPFASKRKGPDWAAAERDWRTGQFTQAEIARKHGITEQSLSRKMRRDRERTPGAWPQDLTQAVREATRSRVLTEQVKERVKAAVEAGQDAAAETVLAAAEAGAQVILRHRADIKTLRALTFDLTHELTLATHSPEELQRLALIAAQGASSDDEVLAVRRSLDDMLKLHNRAQTLHKLADVAGKLQVLERRAFNLDDEGAGAGGAGGPTRDLSDVERATRLAALLDALRSRQG